MDFAYYALPLAFLSWSLYRLLQIGRRSSKYPPGPPTLPVLGNLHQIPTNNSYLQYQKWAKEYGPVYSLMLGSNVTVVLSSAQAVKDLMDKKSAIYSSRPELYVGQQLVSGGLRAGFMPYGPMWRKIRKVFHSCLSITKAVEYIPYQDNENKQLLFDAMENPSAMLEHLRRFSSSVITCVVFGFRWKSFDEPLLHKLMESIDRFVVVAGGAAFIDFYPVLRRLPAWLMPVKRAALEHHKAEKELYSGLYQTAKHAIVNKLPSARPCACVDIVEIQQEENWSDDLMCYITGNLFEGGSDTTSAELYAFVQALVLYPEVQQKGQAEVDNVIGDDRLPSLEDMRDLPYVRACVKETLRWLPVGVLGALPHAVIEDDYYMGYHIPKGATVILNTWTIHRDPARYPRPERFEPERYLGDNTNSAESANLSDVSKRDHFGFAASRRICPGMHIADRSMLLTISRFFWAFDIKPKKDPNGKDALPEQDKFQPGFAAVPTKFEFDLTPRSEKRAAIVRKEWEKVKEGLDADGQYLKNPI